MRRKNITARVRRGLVVIVCVLLLSGLTVPSVVAKSPSHLPPSYLVVIIYEGWADLGRLASLNLHWLDWQTDRLAAIVSLHELEALRDLGFEVSILDAPATPELYYLVTLSPVGDLSLVGDLSPAGETIRSHETGQTFPYVDGTFILKADPAEAESLSIRGFFIQKLLGPIVLPSTPLSAEVDTSGVVIQEYNPLIQGLVTSVSQTQIYTTILHLQDDDALPGWDAERSRYSYAPELAVERDYIRDRMETVGLDVRYHSFNLGGKPLDNIEGALDGWGLESNTVYIVCAHYDSISDDRDNTAPGADDNASGVAAVLEAARVLSQYRYRHTLRFVTFSGEEQGLYGSYYYVAEARSAGTDIGGTINLDMIAWDSDGDNTMEIHAGTQGDSQALGTAFLNANTTYGVLLVPEYMTYGSTGASDHARFWSHGYPAILVIEDFQDFNPYYHQTSDTMDKLNLPYATKFVQTTVAALAELAEIMPPGVNVEHTGPSTVMTGTLTAPTVQYANPGPNPVTGVVITGTLSPGLTYVEDNSGFAVTRPSSDKLVWQVGYVAPYGRGSFVITSAVAAALPAGTLLSSTVEITGVTSWDDPRDNQATWTGFVPYVLRLPVVLRN